MADLTLSGAIFSASSEPSFGQVLSSGGGNAGAGVVSSGTFSVECRFSLDAPQSGTRVITGQPDAFWIGVDSSGNLLARYGSGGSVAELNTTASVIGGVRHVALSADASTGCGLYLDGVQVASASVSAADAGLTYDGLFTIRQGFGGSNLNFGGSVDEVAVWSTQKYTSNFTKPTSPYFGTELGIQNLWHLNGSGTDSAGGPTIDILPSDTALVYSPYNWKVDSSQAKTINTGAYFKTIINANSVALSFDVTGVDSPLPQIYIVVDGILISKQEVSPSVIVSLPSSDTTYHFLEVYVDSFERNLARWAGAAASVAFLGMALDGGTAEAPVSRRNKILVYGDSITEGASTFQGGGGVIGNSAFQSWALKLGEQLNAEVGVVGFGTQAITVGGYGDTPLFQNSYDELWDGEPRDFSDPPNLCLWLMGTNDGTNNIVNNGLTALNGQLSAMPGTKFVLLRPLINNNQEANLQTISSACNDPSRVRYQTTEGFWDTSESSDGLHPYGWVCLSKIAPSIANSVESDMGGVFTGTPSTANLSITGVPDGTYKTVLFDDSSNEVFRGDVAYASGYASLSNFQALAGTELEGYTIDNESSHVNGAVITGVTV